MEKLKFSTKVWDMIFKVLDSISSIVVLPFAMYALFEEDYELTKLRYYCAAFFFAFGLSFFFQALRKRNSQKRYVWELLQVALYLVSVILIIVVPNTDVSTGIITYVFAGMLIMNRVRSIVREHTYQNILFNAACMLLVVAAIIMGGFVFVCLYMLAVDLIHIVSLSFSGMDMEILTKVIRKTYAVDVLSGLILFIAAFSFIFPVLEKGIPTYQDALWYCFAVVTTIGFGDFSATTVLGRVMTVILGIYGIVVVALITSVVVNFYSEVRSLPDKEDPSLSDEGDPFFPD